MLAFINNNFQGLIQTQKNYRYKSGINTLCSQLAPSQPFINSKQLKEVREKYRIHEKDTGSAEYQIAALTVRISYMTAHIKRNPKDYASTRGLIAMVNARKKLLKYLRRENKDRFLKICVGLNIRIQQNQL
jgi:small subunit ribosomal protein S15